MRGSGRFWVPLATLALVLAVVAGVWSWRGDGDAGARSEAASGPQQPEAAYQVFPAGTGAEGQQALPDGQQLARYRVEGGVKVFELTALPVRWSPVKGREVEAWTYNGTVPGPQIRVREGDRVRIVLRNRLPEATTLHFHGIAVPNAMDGVPTVSQEPVPPGGEFTYDFVARPSGTHMYHTHYDALKQEGLGLFGTLVVEPADPEPFAYDAEYSLMISDGPLGYAINGRAFPETVPIKARLGETIRLRLMNVGQQVHPMHLHGYDFTVVAKDGRPLPQPVQQNTLDLLPGDTYDILVHLTEPGTWAFHCHVLSHVEDAQGDMTGLIQVIQVEE